MEIELYSKVVLDNLFQSRPDIRKEMYDNRIDQPFTEGTQHRFMVIPGHRRDLLALPGCDITGSFDQAYYVDLGLDTDDGAAYLGSDTFVHLASLLNYTHADALRQANNRVEELERENDRLRELISRVRLVRDDVNAVSQEAGVVAKGGRKKAPGQSDDAA